MWRRQHKTPNANKIFQQMECTKQSVLHKHPLSKRNLTKKVFQWRGDNGCRTATNDEHTAQKCFFFVKQQVFGCSLHGNFPHHAWINMPNALTPFESVYRGSGFTDGFD